MHTITHKFDEFYIYIIEDGQCEDILILSRTIGRNMKKKGKPLSHS